MVKKENLLYLLIGQDSICKEIKLKQLRQELLNPQTEQFNLDILYARDLDLRSLQEKLKILPVKAKKRIIVIKCAQELKSEVKEFILKYVLNPYPQIVLVLDIDQKPREREFISRILKYARTYHFKEEVVPDVFALSRQIDRNKPDYALHTLNQLLRNGEKPERILGGLRYSWEKEDILPFERRKKLKLLLDCDLDIKTGRLKPSFALERLVLNLCLSLPVRQAGAKCVAVAKSSG